MGVDMKSLFTMIKDAIPPKDNLLAVLCFGFDVKAATFDGFHFYDKETGNQLALGSVKAWADVSHHNEWALPLIFGNLQVYAGAMKAMCDRLEVDK